MRYPIFSFEGDDLFVFDTPNDVRVDLEVYQVDYPDVLLDSDGRLLKKSVEGKEIKLSDSGEEPNPERLRYMLIHALRMRGQEWDDSAPLERLIPTAQATWDQGGPGFFDPLANAASRVLRFLRLRR
jgi:hypothetical protein